MLPKLHTQIYPNA